MKDAAPKPGHRRTVSQAGTQPTHSVGTTGEGPSFNKPAIRIEKYFDDKTNTRRAGYRGTVYYTADFGTARAEGAARIYSEGGKIVVREQSGAASPAGLAREIARALRKREAR